MKYVFLECDVVSEILCSDKFGEADRILSSDVVCYVCCTVNYKMNKIGSCHIHFYNFICWNICSLKFNQP